MDLPGTRLLTAVAAIGALGALALTVSSDVLGDSIGLATVAAQEAQGPDYAPDSTLAATTVIYKVAGYNPEAGNWF